MIGLKAPPYAVFSPCQSPVGFPASTGQAWFQFSSREGMPSMPVSVIASRGETVQRIAQSDVIGAMDHAPHNPHDKLSPDVAKIAVPSTKCDTSEASSSAGKADPKPAQGSY